MTEGGYPRKRAQTRNRLIRAAIECLASSTLDGLTISEVTGVAEVAVGTFYNHFNSLDELIDAAAEQLGAAVEIAKQTLDLLEHDPADRVAIGIYQLLALADSDPAGAAAFVNLVGTRPAFRARIRAIVGGALRDGSEAGRFSVPVRPAVLNAVLGTALQSMRSRFLGEVGADEAPEVVVLIMSMLGLDALEASDVAERARDLSRDEVLAAGT
jgi:AcrR family transcriptional regulator